jgi:hypothetical protein
MMKKVIFTFIVLALSVLLVGSTYAQTPTYNKATLFLSKSGVITSTANDTTAWLQLTTGGTGDRTGVFDVSYYFRSNDSLQCHVYYQLKCADANYTGAWVLLDSVIVVDDAGAATDTTTIGVAAKNTIPSTTLKGATAVRWYFDYNAGTVGTAASAAGDGNTNLFRMYVFIRPLFVGRD